MKNKVEIWKDIDFLNNNYSVSNRGNVKSNDRVASDGRKIKGRIMKMYKIQPRGYLTVVFMIDGKKKHYLVHRLVYCVFNNLDINGKFIIDHIDNNSENNNIDNLQKMTQQENIIKGYRDRKRAKELNKEYKIPKYDGANNNKKGNEKEIVQYDIDGNIVDVYQSIKEASYINGIRGVNISRNLRGVFKTAGGYIWKYNTNNINM